MNLKSVVTLFGVIAVLTLFAVPASAQHIHLDFGHHGHFGHGHYGYGHHFDHHYWGHHDYYPHNHGWYGDYYYGPPVVVRRVYTYPAPGCFQAPSRLPPRQMLPPPARRAPGPAPPVVGDDPFDTSRSAPASKPVPKAFAKLSRADQTAALAQGTCPVTDEPLGDHGTPIKVNVKGRDVFVCCAGCVEDLRNNPERYLRKLSGKTTSSSPRGFGARR